MPKEPEKSLTLQIQSKKNNCGKQSTVLEQEEVVQQGSTVAEEMSRLIFWYCQYLTHTPGYRQLKLIQNGVVYDNEGYALLS
ncbi:hypothetical protein RUM43_003571 [Polyplax serrata]|uniref:Uncharacterized protein n=1 Tax=Polyplax serrata TaxID=468196 RepID=A0AAN8RX62_POLSC